MWAEGRVGALIVAETYWTKTGFLEKDRRRMEDKWRRKPDSHHPRCIMKEEQSWKCVERKGEKQILDIEKKKDSKEGKEWRGQEGERREREGEREGRCQHNLFL